MCFIYHPHSLTLWQDKDVYNVTVVVVILLLLLLLLSSLLYVDGIYCLMFDRPNSMELSTLSHSEDHICNCSSPSTGTSQELTRRRSLLLDDSTSCRILANFFSWNCFLLYDTMHEGYWHLRCAAIAVHCMVYCQCSGKITWWTKI